MIQLSNSWTNVNCGGNRSSVRTLSTVTHFGHSIVSRVKNAHLIFLLPAFAFPSRFPICHMLTHRWPRMRMGLYGSSRCLISSSDSLTSTAASVPEIMRTRRLLSVLRRGRNRKRRRPALGTYRSVLSIYQGTWSR